MCGLSFLYYVWQIGIAPHSYAKYNAGVSEVHYCCTNNRCNGILILMVVTVLEFYFSTSKIDEYHTFSEKMEQYSYICAERRIWVPIIKHQVLF